MSLTPNKTRKLVIVGDSAFAEIAYEYFTHDSSYEVKAFSVETPFLKKDRLFGLPVVPLETLEQTYPAKDHEVFVAVTYLQLNRVRARLCRQAKAKGFRLASYVSSKAFIWPNVQLGEHCFIFEHNVVQPFVRLGEDVILWSGNHIGHHSVIGSHVFIASHVVISGFVEVGDFCFFGVNVTVINNLKIHRDCWIGPGITLMKEAPAGSFYKPGRAVPEPVSALEKFGVKE